MIMRSLGRCETARHPTYQTLQVFSYTTREQIGRGAGAIRWMVMGSPGVVIYLEANRMSSRGRFMSTVVGTTHVIDKWVLK